MALNTTELMEKRNSNGPTNWLCVIDMMFVYGLELFFDCLQKGYCMQIIFFCFCEIFRWIYFCQANLLNIMIDFFFFFLLFLRIFERFCSTIFSAVTQSSPSIRSFFGQSSRNTAAIQRASR